jgi:hypothetical protein
MKDNGRTQALVSLPAMVIVAVALLALLFVVHNDGPRIVGIALAPAVLGIAGLIFVAAALMTVDRDAAANRATDTPAPIEARLSPVLFECGLWALALGFAVRLLGLAHG